ncbi:hypothetical protein FQZ97_610860 [compost metagenome]
MLQAWRAPTGPGKAEVVARQVVAGFGILAALGAQRFHVEHLHVAHVRLQAFGALAGVADGPARGVDLAQDVLDDRFIHVLDLLHLVVLAEFLAKAQFLGKLVHDHVVGTAFPQRFDDLFAPLQRAVRRGTAAVGLELRCGGQQINRPVGIQVFRLARHGGHRGGGRRIRIDHHQEVQFVHGALHFQPARLRVGRVPPIKHRAQVGFLVDEVGVFEHAVNPARYGDARLGHQGRRRVAGLDPFVIDAPDVGEVLPGAFGQAVVAR